MNKYFEVNTKTIVGAALGAAIFTLMFMFIKIPSPIPNTNIQPAFGVCAFFATLFGPIAGALIGFVGHALSDAILWGSPWWSWVIADGIAGFGFGLFYKASQLEQGIFRKRDFVRFNLIQITSNIIGWAIVAPMLDIAIYAEPSNKVFTQGVIAAISNSVTTGVIGGLLLFAYAKTRTQKGSLTKG